MTDDFSGNISPAWLSVGRNADQIRVVPKGDETYPLLSMADLLMEYIKQEVEEWHEKEIYEHLKKRTPKKSGWIDSDGIDSDEQLEAIAPHISARINTAPYYPSPTLYIDSGRFKSKTIRSLDFYDYALAYARKKDGCIKFFNESQDRDYVTSHDIIICMDGNTDKYSYITDMNGTRVPSLWSKDDAKEEFADELNVYENSSN